MSFPRLFAVPLLLLGFYAAHAQQARVDLRGTSLGGDHVLSLNGDWEFYWNKLYSPADLARDSTIRPTLLTPPLPWNDIKVNGSSIGGQGFGTYRITLVNLPSAPLMLDIYSVQTAARIFINDSVVAEVGRVGTDAGSSIPMTHDVQVLLPKCVDKAVIVVQMSNFHHRKGGFVHPFELGSPEVITRNHHWLYMLDVLESSALMILGLFLFTLYIFRRKDLSVLYFSLFAITLSFRPVISVNYLIAYLLPGISWAFMLRLEYLGVIFPCLFMTLYLRELFPGQLPALLVRILAWTFIPMAALTVVFSPSVFSWLIPPLLIIIPLGILAFTITIIRAVIAKADGAIYAGLGVIVLFVSLILKVLAYAGIIPPVYFAITLLDIGFIFLMSLILGSRFSLQFVKVELLQEKTEKQAREIELKKAIVEEKNKEILDSIDYAKRLQQAFFPPEKYIREFLPQSFVMYKPKDIVSGDFYWMQVLRDPQRILLAVGDCTGHGVPGAMVSVLCNNALNQSVKELGISEPAAILNKTREIVIAEFEKSDEDVKDGMDISLCCIRYESGSDAVEVKWAGANNPLVYVEQGELKELKADKQPIGKYWEPKPFHEHVLRLKKGDCLYLFSDGFADQFGEGKKKFKQSNLKKLLAQNSALPVYEQRERLEDAFAGWKGSMEQVDDVCILGLRL
jgi:serine phosphatase RsbU (regulator of sigma subunit)